MNARHFIDTPRIFNNQKGVYAAASSISHRDGIKRRISPMLTATDSNGMANLSKDAEQQTREGNK